MSIRFVALLAVAASCLAPASAQAGLFGGRSSGCCEVVAPSCCEVICCDPCARPGLLAGLRGRLAAKRCCAPAPVCCDSAPVCCEPAPVCCDAAPVCCDSAPVCCEATVCCKKPGLLARLKSRLASRKCCAPSCGYEVVSSCGCDAGCGCN